MEEARTSCCIGVRFSLFFLMGVTRAGDNNLARCGLDCSSLNDAEPWTVPWARMMLYRTYGLSAPESPLAGTHKPRKPWSGS